MLPEQESYAYMGVVKIALEKQIASTGANKIPYDRLLTIAKAMHLWIFKHTADEQEAYEECGLTPEEDAILGYGGKLEIEATE